MYYRMPSSKTGWPSLNVVIFPPLLHLFLTTHKSDCREDYGSNSQAELDKPAHLTLVDT